MIRSLRTRLLIGIAPLLSIMVALGLWAVVMFAQLGSSIEVILNENYASVRAAHEMDQALGQIDAALLTAALVGRDAGSRPRFERGRRDLVVSLDRERRNVTIHPREDQLVADLDRLTASYLDAAARFLDDPGGPGARDWGYFGRLGPMSGALRGKVAEVLALNQANMEAMDRRARHSASRSIRLMIAAILGATILAAAVAVGMSRSLLGTIGGVTRAARSMAAGDVDQVIPVTTRDELGELASAFNGLARTIREYRRAGTERLVRAQRTAQATIDSFPDPVVVVDPDGLIERANPAARRLLGVGVGAGAAGAWAPPPAIRPQLDAALAGVAAPSPSLDRALTIRDGGLERRFLPHALTIRDEAGVGLGAAVVLTDVTRLHRADQLKTDMVATVSHELKTPLTSVLMAIHLLLEEAVGPLEVKQVDLLMSARADADRLLAMVDDLLDLSRIEHGRVRLDLRPVTPAELMDDVVERFEGPARDLGVTLRRSVESEATPIVVDRERIGLAFANVVDNAVRHSPRGGEVRISCVRSAGGVRFLVEDDGSGIAAEHRGAVFDKFFRVPGSAPKSGAGLGLAIAREVVSAHGGRIEVGESPGGGASFAVDLPTAPGPAATAEGNPR